MNNSLRLSMVVLSGLFMSVLSASSVRVHVQEADKVHFNFENHTFDSYDTWQGIQYYEEEYGDIEFIIEANGTSIVMNKANWSDLTIDATLAEKFPSTSISNIKIFMRPVKQAQELATVEETDANQVSFGIVTQTAPVAAVSIANETSLEEEKAYALQVSKILTKPVTNGISFVKKAAIVSGVSIVAGIVGDKVAHTAGYVGGTAVYDWLLSMMQYNN